MIRTLPADLLTPVGAYLLLRDALGAPAFLLESVERGEQVGRYSFLAAGLRSTESLDEAVAFAASRPGPAPGEPPFVGGAVGHISYDWVAGLEPVPMPAPHPDDAGLPELRFMLADSVVAFDHVRRTVSLIGSESEVERLESALAQPPAATDRPVPRRRRLARRDVTLRHYLAAVERAREHIAAGDAFQIVLSQRVRRAHRAHRRSRSTARCARSTPRRTCSCSTAATFQLVGSSPETHVRLDMRRHRELRPIAGTRPRGARPAPRTTRWPPSCSPTRQGAGRARDAGRPGAQRPRPRLPPGTVQVEPATWTSSATRHVMHIVSQRRGPASGPAATRFDLLRGDVPGRHAVGRAEGAGDADHRRAGAGRRGAVRRRRRLRRLRRRHGHMHRDPHHGDARRRCATCRPARASWPTPSRSASMRSA